VSANDAWAVGAVNLTGKTVIMHWNGTAWSPAASPNPSTSVNSLAAVSADSRADAWAVGSFTSATQRGLGLIVHWNGRAWHVVKAANPGGGDDLFGVSALSPTDVWAVGQYCPSQCHGGTSGADLILHWNGTAWSQVTAPDPGPGTELTAVSADSPTDAWAVGSYRARGGENTVTLHWDGTAWSVVPSPSPNPMDLEGLAGVSALSPTDVWAVGSYCISSCGETGSADGTLALHWDGTAWTQVPTVNPNATSSRLAAVSAVSPTSVWAVGDAIGSNSGFDSTLTEHWNGTAWSRIRSPSPSPSANFLIGLAARTGAGAWAVGGAYPPSTTLIEHWNGKAWSQS
jgi:hypothetical protein